MVIRLIAAETSGQALQEGLQAYELQLYIAVVSSSLRTMHADGRLTQIDSLSIDHEKGGVKLYEQDLKICEELGLLGAWSCMLDDNVVRLGAADHRRYVRSQLGSESEELRYTIVLGELTVSGDVHVG